MKFVFIALVPMLLAACTQAGQVDLSPLEGRLSDLEKQVEELDRMIQWEDCQSLAEREEDNAYQDYLAENETYAHYERIYNAATELSELCDAEYLEGIDRDRSGSIQEYLDLLEEQ